MVAKSINIWEDIYLYQPLILLYSGTLLQYMDIRDTNRNTKEGCRNTDYLY